MQTKSDSSRSLILDKIKKAKETRPAFNLQTPDWDSNIYKKIEPSLEECFANELSTVNGLTFLCETEQDVFSKIKERLFEKGVGNLFCRSTDIVEKLGVYGIPVSTNEADFLDMQAGITCCESLVARTGSVMVSSASSAGRQLNIYPPIHIVVAKKSQLVPYLSDALSYMKQKYGLNLPSTITNITGPSRTADIEKTLILGAHGPKEFWVFINCSE